MIYRGEVMSHFTVLRTQIKEVSALVKGLSDLGFRNVEVHDTDEFPNVPVKPVVIQSIRRSK